MPLKARLFKLFDSVIELSLGDDTKNKGTKPVQLSKTTQSEQIAQIDYSPYRNHRRVSNTNSKILHFMEPKFY